LLELENISINAGTKHLFKLNQLNLEVGLVALVGRNGTGKSTFIRTLLGDNKNYSGKINWKGKSLTEISPSERAKLIAVVYSKPQIFGNHTVIEVLLLGRIPHQNIFTKITSADWEITEKILDLLNLHDFRDTPFNILSDGEKQLVMIGRALVQQTPIILLDEPGAFLDLVNRYQLAALLKRIANQENRLVIYSTHHIDLLEEYCTGILLIDKEDMKFHNNNTLFLSTIRRAFNLSANE